MLVTKTYKINSIEITYMRYSFSTEKHYPINGCIRIAFDICFDFDSSLSLKKIFNIYFPGRKVTISQANATKMFE